VHSTGLASCTCVEFANFQPRSSAQFLPIRINYFPQYLHVILFSDFFLVVSILSFYFFYSVFTAKYLSYSPFQNPTTRYRLVLIPAVMKSEEETSSLSTLNRVILFNVWSSITKCDSSASRTMYHILVPPYAKHVDVNLFYR